MTIYVCVEDFYGVEIIRTTTSKERAERWRKESFLRHVVETTLDDLEMGHG